MRQQNIDLAQLRHDLFGFVLLLGHSNVLLRLNSLLQGGPLFRGQTNIASTLGFSDAVGFRHAFKRWTGTTPSDVRRKRGR
nr:helix-turn-helix domain-containing protein [Burkholderia multivorans]